MRALAWLGVALVLQTHFFLLLLFFFLGGREIPPSFPAVSALNSFLLFILLAGALFLSGFACSHP